MPNTFGADTVFITVLQDSSATTKSKKLANAAGNKAKNLGNEAKDKFNKGKKAFGDGLKSIGITGVISYKSMLKIDSVEIGGEMAHNVSIMEKSKKKRNYVFMGPSNEGGPNVFYTIHMPKSGVATVSFKEGTDEYLYKATFSGFNENGVAVGNISAASHKDGNGKVTNLPVGKKIRLVK